VLPAQKSWWCSNLGTSDPTDSLFANNTMPCRAVQPVKLPLDEHGDILFDVVPLERGGRGVDGALLHLLGHCRAAGSRWD
jgi:2-succinyl-5-enolpyruvyl-6-hydroxy-3-cyclohexene-1-carboxylate synthase